MNIKLIISYFGGIITLAIINYLRRNKRKLLNIIVKAKIISAEKEKIKNSVYKSRGNVITQLSLCEDSIPAESIIGEIRGNYYDESKNWTDGGLSGSVYYNFHTNEDLCHLISRVYNYSFMANPMHLSEWPSIINQEVQVVRWIANMYHGDQNVVGSMTGGGTDSNMEVCLTYRKLAQQELGITDPVIIIPSSAHVSFLKAGDDHQIEIVVIDVDRYTRLADIGAIEAAIKRYGRRVIALVGSAPSYSDGLVDNIEELARLALSYSNKFNTTICVHVDACLGSFVIPFSEQKFDFLIAGVTSISVDTHKFGNAPKGGSVLLYRNMDIMRHQMRIYTSWEGGIYPTPTRLGSRPGGIIACTYAVMKYFGMRQYRQFAKEILQVANRFRYYITHHPDLELVGESKLMVVSFKFKNDSYNIYQLAELLKKEYHWELNKLQKFNRIHFCFTSVHTKDNIVERLIKDVDTSVQICKASPNTQTGDAAVYCSLQRIPKDIADQAVLWYQEATIEPILG